MWIEIFKSGTHTDSNGNTIQYSDTDINTIITRYNERVENNPNDAAPLVKGHPKSIDPAFGWVERLVKRGNTIVAKIIKLDPQLANDIKNEKYKHFSIAITNDLRLRHIGIMGAVPPAVKNLNKNGIVYFSEENNSNFSEFDFKITSNPQDKEDDINNIDNAILDLLLHKNNELDNENEALLRQMRYLMKMVIKVHNTNEDLKSKLEALEKTTSQNTFQEPTSTIVSDINEKDSSDENSNINDLNNLSADNENPNIKNSNIDETTSNISDDTSDTSPNSRNQVPTSCFNSSIDNSTAKKVQESILKDKKLSIYDNNIELTKQLNFAENIQQTKNIEIDFSNKNINQERLDYHNKILQYIKQNPNTTYADAIYLI